MEQKNKISWWIVLVFGILSLINFIGMLFTYSGNLIIHSIGNYLWTFHLIYFIPEIIGIICIISLIYKKQPFSRISIPLLYVFLPLISFIISFISYYMFGVPVYSSAFAENIIFRIITDNYFVMIYNLAVFIFSLYVLKRIPPIKK